MSISTVVVDSALPALHIPDGFLSPAVAAGGWVVAAAAVAYSARRANRDLDERAVPLMGVMAAFIFAAQMINFPVAGGTSGHLLGGTLAALLLGGPWLAIVVMTSVVALQAVLFQDGGLLAMGANIANMGVLTSVGGYGIVAVLRPLLRGRTGMLVAAGIGAWVSVEVSAAAAGLELAWSGTSALSVVMPALLGVHALIGLGEAAITAAALAFVVSTRPDLVGRMRAGSEVAS
ncbi:MAG: energy-coupling factor ABC transporter permease [Dehalococcoidia bacterium]